MRVYSLQDIKKAIEEATALKEAKKKPVVNNPI